jgi:hypothetical protein
MNDASLLFSTLLDIDCWSHFIRSFSLSISVAADLKVVWRAKNISGGLPISGGFLADLTHFFWVCFCLADLADYGGFGAFISKKQLESHFIFA